MRNLCNSKWIARNYHFLHSSFSAFAYIGCGHLLIHSQKCHFQKCQNGPIVISKVSNSTPFDTIQHHMTPYIWCQDTKQHHSTLVCFFKFWQKWWFFKNFAKNWWFFKFLKKNLCQSWLFFTFLQENVYLSKFIKKWWFFKFWP